MEEKKMKYEISAELMQALIRYVENGRIADAGGLWLELLKVIEKEKAPKAQE